MPAKTLTDHLFEPWELPGQRREQTCLGQRDGRVGGLDRRRLAQHRRAKRCLDGFRAGLDAAAAVTLEDGGDLRPGQSGGPVGVRGPLEQLDRVRVGEVKLARGQRVEQSRVVFAQRLAQTLQVAGPVPDQALVSAGDQL
ncbi:hypothetical protein LWC35_37275, partial [Pseudonocardia kujensis]|uniref:hypothetical protein n=1 Tax=Pseudonocardia kujensis TaxID=1128675 RepID=UPI001E58CBD6